MYNVHTYSKEYKNLHVENSKICEALMYDISNSYGIPTTRYAT